MLDLIIRGGTVWTPDGPLAGDLAAADGLIVAIGPELAGPARTEIDARGLDVVPGVIDAHVHLNDPGRADWEGFATGTAALAAGGTTCFADMPLNCVPATVDRASLEAKLLAARGRARVDFALWGGLVPGDLDRLDELAAAGVVGFKAFLSPSGVDEFSAVDDLTLFEGMQRAATLGLPVAVHAESAEITTRLAARAIAADRRTMADYLASRPVVAELEAVERALLLAGEARCHVHLCHLSTARAVDLVVASRARGVRATCETCPHYLLLDAADAVRLGAVAKCAPPLRGGPDRAALVVSLECGDLDLVASDHSPSPASLKTGDDLFAAWGGISGGQTLLAGVLTAGLGLAAALPLLTAAPAGLLGLDRRKGALVVGRDADVVVVDVGASATLDAHALRYRHRHAPLIGRRLVGAVHATVVRGRVVTDETLPFGRFAGRL